MERRPSVLSASPSCRSVVSCGDREAGFAGLLKAFLNKAPCDASRNSCGVGAGGQQPAASPHT